MKQFIYKFITNPIAKTLDFFNFPKKNLINRKRKILALQNKHDYIEMIANLLLEQEIVKNASKGLYPNPYLISIIFAKHIEQAITMFQEKKANGDFDELNIMLK